MKKIFTVILVLLTSCNGIENDTRLLDEIKGTTSPETFGMTIESYSNKVAGVSGSVEWRLTESKNSNGSKNLVILEALIKTSNGYFNGYTGREVNCQYQWIYNTNTKQAQLWFQSVEGKVVFEEGEYVSRRELLKNYPKTYSTSNESEKLEAHEKENEEPSLEYQFLDTNNVDNNVTAPSGDGGEGD